ncbi:hypothetical protein ACFLWX_04210 [Chloroflexota bacterium]
MKCKETLKSLEKATVGVFFNLDTIVARGVRILRCSEVVLLTVVLTATVMFAGCGGKKGLPDYVGRVSGGSMQIDVVKASGGSAHVDEEGTNIIYDRGDYKLIFTLKGFSLTAGIGKSYLSNPPVKISPLITPGNDVADLFAAVRIDEQTSDLYVTVFMDTDWQEVVTGEIFLHTQEAVLLSDHKLQQTVETADFSNAVDGVYMHELRFKAEDNLGDYDTSPWICVTNITGETEDLLRKISMLELSIDHVFIAISPQVVKP